MYMNAVISGHSVPCNYLDIKGILNDSLQRAHSKLYLLIYARDLCHRITEYSFYLLYVKNILFLVPAYKT